MPDDDRGAPQLVPRESPMGFAQFVREFNEGILDTEVGAAMQKLLAVLRDHSLQRSGVTVEHEIHQNTALGSGAGQLVFKERHKDTAGQPLSVPGGFLLAIPVFDGGDRWKLLARLRYRVVNQRVMWTYQLHKVREVIREAFQEAATGIALSTELPLFFGDPE